MTSVLHTLRFRLDHRWVSQRMSDYLDGDLGSAGERRVQHHVHECERCRRLEAALRRMVQTLRAAPAPVTDADATALAAKVRTRLSDAP
jgi:anti-sigma factor RsiW